MTPFQLVVNIVPFGCMILSLSSCLPPSYSSIHMAAEFLKLDLVSLSLIFENDGYSDVSVMKAKK